MRIIDGKDAILGRVASYAAKEALKGEDIAVVNCEKLKVTGNKVFIKKNFEEKGGESEVHKVVRRFQEIVKKWSKE